MTRPLRYPRDPLWWCFELAAVLANNAVLKRMDARICRWANLTHLPRRTGD